LPHTSAISPAVTPSTQREPFLRRERHAVQTHHGMTAARPWSSGFPVSLEK
jgi:hypothetical protein